MFVSFFLVAGVRPSFAAENGEIHINLVLDASGSMWEKIDKKTTRIEEAKKALNAILDDLAAKKGISVGLRVYGHRSNKCDDTKLEIPIGPLDAKKMKKFIAGIKPKGKTPIALSLQEAAKDFNPKFTGRKIIVLVTDGLESCGGDPCAVARALAEKGVVSKIHVVGFGMDKKSTEALACISSPSGGMLFEAKDAASLVQAFDKIVKVSSGSVLEVKGVDGNGNPVEFTASVTPGERVLVGRGAAAEPLGKGTYSVRAVASATGETIDFQNVELLDGEITTLKAVFAVGTLRIRALDKDKKVVGVFGRVRAAENPSETYDFGGEGECDVSLRPGAYEIEIEQDGTRPARKGEAVVENGKTTVKEFAFGDDSGLNIAATGFKGGAVHFGIMVYDADGNPVEEAWGTGKISLKLAPGTYDVSVHTERPGEERRLRNIRLDEGAGYSADIAFPMGEIVFTGKVAHITARFVDRKSGAQIEDSSAAEGRAVFLIPSGVYDIYTTDSEGEEREFPEINLKENASVVITM